MNTEATVTTNEDGSIITINLPISFKRHGGRKTIISPQGCKLNEDRDEKQDFTLLKAIVNAHRWQKMLYEGKYDSISRLCEGEGIAKGNMSTILRMVNLAPDIQEAIIKGTYPNHLTRANFVRKFPVEWSKQREIFGFPA